MGHINKSQEWFKEKVRKYHGDKVDIIGEYNGSENPIELIYHCEKHGDTTTTINAKNICKNYFLPCKECQRENKSKKGLEKHDMKDKKYYYQRLKQYCEDHDGILLSKEWKTAKTIYEFKCNDPNHPPFRTTADSLYSGNHWCPYCCGRRGDFENEIEQIVQSKNGELLSEYINAGTYIKVRCKTHNYDWDILPNNIKKGRWCPICSMPFSEKVVWDYLNSFGLNIEIQYKFDSLEGKNNEKLKFDFALLSNKNELIYLIEIDDEEHRDNHDNCKKRLIARERDNQKNKYCIDNNINLYRMDVPFRQNKKWAYDDYYRYINTELKSIVNLVLSNDKGGR
jgi:hypothetical protein